MRSLTGIARSHALSPPIIRRTIEGGSDGTASSHRNATGSTLRLMRARNTGAAANRGSR
jgi:hypothetical protein